MVLGRRPRTIRTNPPTSSDGEEAIGDALSQPLGTRPRPRRGQRPLRRTRLARIAGTDDSRRAIRVRSHMLTFRSEDSSGPDSPAAAGSGDREAANAARPPRPYLAESVPGAGTASRRDLKDFFNGKPRAAFGATAAECSNWAEDDFPILRSCSVIAARSPDSWHSPLYRTRWAPAIRSRESVPRSGIGPAAFRPGATPRADTSSSPSRRHCSRGGSWGSSEGASRSPKTRARNPGTGCSSRSIISVISSIPRTRGSGPESAISSSTERSSASRRRSSTRMHLLECRCL